jgi:hypothetical protein
MNYYFQFNQREIFVDLGGCFIGGMLSLLWELPVEAIELPEAYPADDFFDGVVLPSSQHLARRWRVAFDARNLFGFSFG